ncbi:hypothetical protein JTF08_13555 [Micrococcaceae bacterium RIT802]|nr:hypothetical protein [Micrococcaceae bacterium RIT 802]
MKASDFRPGEKVTEQVRGIGVVFRDDAKSAEYPGFVPVRWESGDRTMTRAVNLNPLDSRPASPHAGRGQTAGTPTSPQGVPAPTPEQHRLDAVDRMQRAQRHLRKAAQLEGTGQPMLCATYARRAVELIDEARTSTAAYRGPKHATRLALQRSAQVLVDAIRPAWQALKRDLRAAGHGTQADFTLAGPSKGGRS